MKTFKNQAAQGDIMLMRVDKLPKDVTKTNAKNGRYVVAHSETGHDHVIQERPNVILYETSNPMISYLQVIEATDKMETLLEHLRNFSTHETLRIEPGIYQIRRQREARPKGWQMVND